MLTIPFCKNWWRAKRLYFRLALIEVLLLFRGPNLSPPFPDLINHTDSDEVKKITPKTNPHNPREKGANTLLTWSMRVSFDPGLGITRYVLSYVKGNVNADICRRCDVTQNGPMAISTNPSWTSWTAAVKLLPGCTIPDTLERWVISILCISPFDICLFSIYGV